MLLALGLANLPTTVRAQTPLPSPATPSVPAPEIVPAQVADPSSDEIVVTAQRRSENIQKVPITVLAVSQETLLAVGATSAANIQVVVPGLVIQKTYAGASPYLRGIGTFNSGFTSEMPVATYIDGFYLPNAASGVFAFNNIERIEVLKGPQGTLFGRNAVGGLIQVITRDPTQEAHLEASVGYGSYDTYDASLYASTGIASNLAMDIAGVYHDQRDGLGRNVLTGSDIFKNRETSVSSKLKWTPSVDTEVTLRAFYDNTNSDQGAGYGVFPGSVGVDGTRYIGKYEIANRRDPEMFSEQYNVGLKVSQNLGFATLLSLTGFNHTDNTVRASQNGIPGLPVTGQSGIEFNNIGTSRTFTQEVQLLSRGDGGLQWILGAFYLHDRLDLIVETLPTCVGNVCARAPTASRIFGGQDLKSYAAFGETTIALGGATRLTFGARYTSDHRDISDGYREPIQGLPVSVPSLPAPIRPGDPFPGFPNGIDPTVTFEKVTWRGVIAHDFTPHVMTYASVNRGFKAGALSPVTASNPAARPEVLDAYEIGVKSQLFDRRLRANLSAYHYDYKDVQLRTLGPPAPPGTSIIYNAAAARVRGVDAEFVVTASSRLRLNASFSIVDAKFTSFPAGICSITRPINPAGTPVVLGGTTSAACDLSGFRMPRAPKFTGIAGFSYRVPTRMGAFGLVVNDAYNSGFFWEPDNRLRQRSYHQLSGSITWTTPDDRFDVQLYGRNVNSPYYFNAAAEGAGGNDTYNPGDRATYGVRLGMRL